MNSSPPSSVVSDPWEKSYFFARMLINSDKYGRPHAVPNIDILVSYLEGVIKESLPRLDIDEAAIVESAKSYISSFYESKTAQAPKRSQLIRRFADKLTSQIHSLEDLSVLVLAITDIVNETTEALTHVPSHDRDFAQAKASVLLTTEGEAGLSTIFTEWDELGELGCLEQERRQVVRAYSRVKTQTANLSENSQNQVLTALVQEFERRLGQKRKTRGGRSLEDALSLVFDFYEIPSADGPTHFQADIEIDKWARCKDGFYLGISCKRTLRERWKQTSSADRFTLQKNRIKEVWHITTYDQDLSVSKLSLLASHGHIFYLADDSEVFLNYKDQKIVADSVRPLSRFVADLRKEVLG